MIAGGPAREFHAVTITATSRRHGRGVH